MAISQRYPLTLAVTLAGCLVAQVATANPAYRVLEKGGQVVEIRGLNDSTDCAFAETTGTVKSVELVRDGSMVEGFFFVNEFGEGYVNLDEISPTAGKKTAAKIRKGLKRMLRPGNKLKVGVHGCGASGRIQKLVNIKQL